MDEKTTISTVVSGIVCCVLLFWCDCLIERIFLGSQVEHWLSHLVATNLLLIPLMVLFTYLVQRLFDQHTGRGPRPFRRAVALWSISFLLFAEGGVSPLSYLGFSTALLVVPLLFTYVLLWWVRLQYEATHLTKAQRNVQREKVMHQINPLLQTSYEVETPQITQEYPRDQFQSDLNELARRKTLTKGDVTRFQEKIKKRALLGELRLYHQRHFGLGDVDYPDAHFQDDVTRELSENLTLSSYMDRARVIRQKMQRLARSRQLGNGPAPASGNLGGLRAAYDAERARMQKVLYDRHHQNPHVNAQMIDNELQRHLQQWLRDKGVIT